MPETASPDRPPKQTPRTRLFATPALLVALTALLFAPSAQASGGGAMGWGYDFYGQAGNGTAITTPPWALSTPTAVPGISGVTQVGPSRYHTLVLLSDGTVKAFGFGIYGELGNGGVASSAAPVTVSGLGNVVAVAAGAYHSLALLADGTVMAWGNNQSGALGIGNSSGPQTCESAHPCSKAPVPVPGLTDVVAIAAGENFSLALLANGTVVGWGDDQYGELGDGTGVSGGCKCIDHPVPIPGVSGVMAISGGGLIASALLADGTVRNWGYNYFGGLGTGSTTPLAGCACLGPVSPNGISGAVGVAAGFGFDMALLADGTVRAWGQNGAGELGTGTVTASGCNCIPSPVPVSGLTGVREIDAGNEHALALLTDGSVRAWGENSNGAIGDGTTTTPRPAPVAAIGVGGAGAIAAGEGDSFAQVGPTQNLAITITGSGAGTVGGPKSVLCPPACARPFPQGQVEILRAEPAAGSAFAGFSGACTGTGPCQLRMDSDQSVAATFGPPSGTKIDKATINNKKKSAKFAFSAPGAITGFECKLIRPKPHHKKHKPKSHKQMRSRASKKRAKPRFAPCAGPKTYKHLAVGSYSFQVRALDSLGADPKPATRKFKIKPPKRGQHHKGKAGR